jgi:GTP cyclohydrolase I
MLDAAQVSRPGSAAVRARLKAAGVPARANDNIAPFVTTADRNAMKAEVEFHLAAAFDAMCIDRHACHNSADTPRRLAKLWCDEVFAGRYVEPPRVTDFPNTAQVNSLYVVGPVEVRSTCSHHFAPIMGQAWFGVVPGERVIGLSKFHRITEWISARPQIQEEQTVQLADALTAAMRPRALAVMVKAQHFCCGWRGVKQPQSEMTTTEFRGEKIDRAQFLALVAQQGGQR